MSAIRIGICALVVFGVLAHGAVEDWARVILEIGAAFLFLYWAVRSFFIRESQLLISPLLLPLLILCLVALAQVFFHTTASVYFTRTDFRLLLTYVVILFLASQAFRTLDDWRAFVWFVMVFGFAVSLFGILQHLTFNGKLYWVREMRYGGIPFGPYANRNHFAGFAELVIPVSLIPLALGKVRRERWMVVGVFAVVPIGALFFSASRGGIISFAIEVGALLLWLVVRKASRKHVLSVAAALLAAFLFVAWLGVRPALERFASMQSLEVTQGKRTSMAADTWRIFLDHPWIGTGLGTLQQVFPRYETLYDGKIVNHSHNDYLEALAETGIAGGFCCAWFLAALFLDSIRRFTNPSSSVAGVLQVSGLVACLGFLTHSLVDFNLHIPANALLFFLLAQLATTQIRPSGSVSPVPERTPHTA